MYSFLLKFRCSRSLICTYGIMNKKLICSSTRNRKFEFFKSSVHCHQKKKLCKKLKMSVETKIIEHWWYLKKDEQWVQKRKSNNSRIQFLPFAGSSQTSSSSLLVQFCCEKLRCDTNFREVSEKKVEPS